MTFLSVYLFTAGYAWKQLYESSNFFNHVVGPSLSSWAQTPLQNSNDDTFNGGVKYTE